MGIAVDRYELGPIGTNCYVARAERGATEAIVIDPSGDATDIRLELAHAGARCAGILVTHCHWDHILGVADLAEGTGAPVYVSADEARVLEDPRSFFPQVPIRPHAGATTLVGHETLELAGFSLEVVRVPGHSPGHLAFYTDGALFSGDVLFADAVGRTDLPFSDWDTLVASIRTLAERFPPGTVVYPGHGPETTLGTELARNPFLAELRAARR